MVCRYMQVRSKCAAHFLPAHHLPSHTAYGRCCRHPPMRPRWTCCAPVGCSPLRLASLTPTLTLTLILFLGNPNPKPDPNPNPSFDPNPRPRPHPHQVLAASPLALRAASPAQLVDLAAALGGHTPHHPLLAAAIGQSHPALAACVAILHPLPGAAAGWLAAVRDAPASAVWISLHAVWRRIVHRNSRDPRVTTTRPAT